MIVDESAITISGLIAEIEELKADKERLIQEKYDFLNFLYDQTYHLGHKYHPDIALDIEIMKLWQLWNSRNPSDKYKLAVEEYWNSRNKNYK